MIFNRIVRVSVALSVLAACAAAPAWADRERGDHDRRGEFRADRREEFRAEQRHETAREFRRDQRRDSRRDERRDFRRERIERDRVPRGYRLDNRYRHNHYYPRRGHFVPTLPGDHRIVHFHGVPYYFHSGAWYRRSGVRFVVVAPPIGLVLPFLPPFYTTIWVGGVPYYYADDVYYVWRPEQNGYVVTEPPAASEVSEEPAAPQQLFIYPKKGQSEKQQATDRYQCYRWAADQTGFDPTQPGGNVPDSKRTAKRADYQRAMKACLEARNYSVK